MNGFKDLLHSERGAFAIAAIVCATVLVALRAIDGALWVDLAKYLGTALIASKTVTSAVATYNTTKTPQVPKAEVVRDETKTP